MINSIENYGYANTIINQNNKQNNLSMEWVANYDGNLADLTLKLNDNGSKKIVDLKLDNEDLINLLNIPSQQSSLDERIRQNNEQFEFPIIVLPPSKKRRKSRNKRSNKRSKLRRRTKKILDLFL